MRAEVPGPVFGKLVSKLAHTGSNLVFDLLSDDRRLNDYLSHLPSATL